MSSEAAPSQQTLLAIKQLDKIPTSALSENDLQFVIGLIDQNGTNSAVSDALANKLFAIGKNGDWPPDLWKKLEEKKLAFAPGKTSVG
ncbi:MAG: hypothetical protein J0L82_14370 [Deltaproteobacteria bacterium]|nr:hypothetical protein [Deltaproteobacteria bacterium]